LTPSAVRCEARETIAPADVGGLRCKRRGKPATPRRILGYASGTVAAIRT
jgi:hypothetical protein